MERKRLLTLIGSICLTIVLMALSLIAACAKPAPTPAPAPMPESLSIASYDVGGGAYIQSAALGEGIFKAFGIRVRSVPVATGVARTNMVRQGQTDFGLTVDDLNAAEGIYDFASIDWGPQPLRSLYIIARQSCYSLCTAGDTGIKTAADMKGKRAAWPIGSNFSQNVVRSGIAFAGLTLDDVELVEMRSIPAMYQAVIDGTVDFCPMDGSGTKAYELASSPKGIHWIPFPAADKDGWKRIQTINPQQAPLLCKYGAGIDEAKPVEVSTVPFPRLFVYDNADSDQVYWIVKLIAESYDAYKDIAMPMAWWKVEDCVKMPIVAPYHPGAIKYFKEIGIWTDQLEKNQQELLDRQAKLRKLWDDTVAEATDQGVKAKEFSEFWLKKRAQEFPSYWVETPVK